MLWKRTARLLHGGRAPGRRHHGGNGRLGERGKESAGLEVGTSVVASKTAVTVSGHLRIFGLWGSQGGVGRRRKHLLRHGDRTGFHERRPGPGPDFDLERCALGPHPRDDQLRHVRPTGVPRRAGRDLGRNYSPWKYADGFAKRVLAAGMGAPILLLADALGVELDDLVSSAEIEAIDKDLDLPMGPIPAGTIAGYRLRGMGRARRATPRFWPSSTSRAWIPPWPRNGRRSTRAAFRLIV